jgi:hypothetical protein
MIVALALDESVAVRILERDTLPFRVPTITSESFATG